MSYFIEGEIKRWFLTWTQFFLVAYYWISTESTLSRALRNDSIVFLPLTLIIVCTWNLCICNKVKTKYRAFYIYYSDSGAAWTSGKELSEVGYPLMRERTTPWHSVTVMYSRLVECVWYKFHAFSCHLSFLIILGTRWLDHNCQLWPLIIL